MSNENTVIPDEYVEFCKEVAKMAAKLQLYRMSMSIQPGYDSTWRSNITMSWASGRHGDEAEQVRISSQVDVFTKVNLYGAQT
jgi:hypothetical protein